MDLIGGIGLFLLGMIIMTDGLRALAGDALRHWLIRTTRSPYTGALSGAVCTALLQSSSATTVAAVGFVAANLMSFPAALGVIFGANLGTTITGWMVALIGFKIKLGLIAAPIVFVGAALRLFSKGKTAALGMAVAGFAVIFIGVNVMQEAMAGFQDVFVFNRWPGETFLDRLVLVAIGAGFTIVAQSSSAGVAATLTALHAGVVTFPQAAALVIGMDVGTTVTALVAVTGASVNARRTGFSHVIYNLMTGFAALLILPLYVQIANAVNADFLPLNGEVALVAFHSLFNGLGVIAVLPVAHSFAHMMERLIPGDSPSYTHSLDEALLTDPGSALDSVNASVKLELLALLKITRSILVDGGKAHVGALAELQTSLDETHAYLDRIHLNAEVGPNWDRLLAALHGLDHAQRLHERCEDRLGTSICGKLPQALSEQRSIVIDGITATIEALENERPDVAKTLAETMASEAYSIKVPYRDAVLSDVAEGDFDVFEGSTYLSMTRWLRRVSKHIARATGYVHDCGAPPRRQ